MIYSGLFNSVNGDRKYNAWWFAKYFSTFIANGVFPNPSTNLQVIENENMSIVIKPGTGWINGYFLYNDSDYILTHDTADGVLSRIDRIVMSLNYANRQINISIKKGTFASSPVAPSLQRDADIYELALADVFIGPGVTVISQSNITDQRLNTSLCGVVHGTVNQVDTTTIFNQYQAWYQQVTGSTQAEIDAWQAQQEQEFNDWFATVQNTLSGDVAGNLASQITTLQQDFTAHKAEFATYKEATDAELAEIENANYLSIVKSNKDSEGIFKTVTYKRKTDNSVFATSVLSGGTSPQYTTRTLIFYETDGTTVKSTKIFTLSYDSDGDLVSEVINSD